MKSYFRSFLMVFAGLSLHAGAQVVAFPYSESFDYASAPSFPQGWSSDGFVLSETAFRSSPNCISVTGNTETKSVTSPVFDFTDRTPDRLIFWERRSATASLYRLDVCASTDGVNFDLHLDRFDTISTTSGYIKRVVDISGAGLDQKPAVRFRWCLLRGDANDSVNTRGVLRIDDVMLTVMAGYDLGITAAGRSQADAVSGDPAVISLTVRNYGVYPVSDFSVKCFIVENKNAGTGTLRQFYMADNQSVGRGDSVCYTVMTDPLKEGIHLITAVVWSDRDENQGNDSASVIVGTGGDRCGVIINEIMYEPLEFQDEWVELFNRSSDTVDLSGWRLGDRFDSHEIPAAGRFLFPQRFAIVAAESSIFKIFPDIGRIPQICICIFGKAGLLALNNDADAVVLQDMNGRTIDSVWYSSERHNPYVTDSRGRSLERINPETDSNDPRNWSTCAVPSGGTPGCVNSLFASAPNVQARVSISPNPFSPDGDGFEDFCMVHYNLPMRSPAISIRIFDVRGRLIRDLARAEPAGGEGNIIWDGLDDARQRVRIGVYVILLEAEDAASNSVLTAKAVAVVATRL